MKKAWIAPIIILVIMMLLACLSSIKIYVPEINEIPGAFARFVSFILGMIVSLCIILGVTIGELRLEKISEKAPKAEAVAEALPPTEEAVAEVPPAIPEEEVAKPAPPTAEEEMVVCGSCGALVPASTKKCPNCGAEFEE